MVGMSVSSLVRVFSVGLFVGCSAAAAHAEDLYLAEVHQFPGRLLLSEGFTAERALLHREARPNPAYPRAEMKLAHVAVGPENKVYYVSGLDGYVMHLLDGRHEIQIFEIDGQIRDLACTGEEHTVYFSVVPTPQDGAPLADGKILRRDLWEGRPTELATVRQADVGGNWWGCFTIKNGTVYIVTLHEESRIYKLTADGPVRVFDSNRWKITGLSSGYDDDFYFTTGTGKVYRTKNFVDVETVLEGDRRYTDVGLRASSEWPRP